MNTELSVEELLDPLQTVIGVVEKKQTLPILSHVLIQLKEKKLTLTTTDMELEISASGKIKSDDEVTFTIYAKDLIDIVRKLPEKTLIKFKIEEKKIYLNANKNTFELNTFDHLDFPALPKTQNTSVINIKQELLKELRTLEQRVIDSKSVSSSVMLELRTLHSFVMRAKELEDYLKS